MLDVEVPDDDGPLVIKSDGNWKLQRGDRASAYAELYRQCADHVRENDVDLVVVKASAVPGRGSATLGLLTGAEVRGVVIAAARASCAVQTLAKAAVSKTYGDRKVGEYVEDDEFWDGQTTGPALRKSSRETAMLLIAARNAR